jgi:nucleotide-binding universal stress UspA family protein
VLDQSAAIRPRRSVHPPFARILCAVDGEETDAAAVEQALAVADGDASVAFATSWYSGGSLERDARARATITTAVERAREAGLEARDEWIHAPALGEALLGAAATHDLVVIGASSHARATGIVLGEPATVLVHRCPVPVLIARTGPLRSGIVAGTRGLPSDRPALTAAAHLAARLGAELTVVHVTERHDERRANELSAELANARALLGRGIDFYRVYGAAARTIVDAAVGDGAGLVVVGSTGRTGLSAVASVSERVAHLAPCSVLVMREGQA